MLLVWVQSSASERGRAESDQPPAGEGGPGLSTAAGNSGVGSGIQLKHELLLRQLLQAMAGQRQVERDPAAGQEHHLAVIFERLFTRSVAFLLPSPCPLMPLLAACLPCQLQELSSARTLPFDAFAGSLSAVSAAGATCCANLVIAT